MTVIAVLALAAQTAVADEGGTFAEELFGSPHLRDFDDLRMIWIRQCSYAAVSETDVGWVVDSGTESETVFLCLLAKADPMELQQISDTDVSALYLPPFNNGFSLRGRSWKQPEAIIRTATKVASASWKGGGWKGAAYIINTDGETEWTTKLYIGSFNRVRYKVRAVYADDSVGPWSPYTERTR